jgi:hypothetical protein
MSSTGKFTHPHRSLTSPKSANAGAEAACELEFSFSFAVARCTPHRAIFGAFLPPSKYIIMEGLRG